MIRVIFETAEEGTDLRLVVADDGPGLPDGFDMTEQTGLGMRLVLSLSSQLGATFEAANAGDGAQFTVRIPTEPHKVA